MSIFSERLRVALDKQNIRASVLAYKTGISEATLSRYLSGNFKAKSQNMKLIANALHVSYAWLEGYDVPMESDEEVPTPFRVPVYGTVAAGIPLEAIEDIEDYEEITEEMAKSGRFAALKIKGNSMLPRFTPGDVVIVKLQDDVESGDIAIVIVNGDEATCKKIKKTPEGVLLISTNPDYEPMFYSNSEIAELPVRIWGKVVELRAKF